MPRFPGQELIQMQERKRLIEASQPDIAGSFGQGLGAGIVKGSDNVFADIAANKKRKGDLLLKALDEYQPVRVKSDGSYDFLTPTEIQDIDTLNDPSIKFVPKSMLKQVTPVEYEEKGADIIDQYTGKPIGKTPPQRVEKGRYVPPILGGVKPQTDEDKEAAQSKIQSGQTKDFLSQLNQSIEKTKSLVLEAGKFNNPDDPKLIKQYGAQLENYQNVQSFVLGGGDIQEARGMIQTFTVTGEPGKKQKRFGIDWMKKDEPDTLKVEGRPAVSAQSGTVIVVNPNGTRGMIPKSQLQEALKQGYTLPK